MNSVNYLLLFEGNSDKGGFESSVRSFSKLEAARMAMIKAYQKTATALGIPAGAGIPQNQYTIRTKDRIRLERYGDWFQWKVIKAVPEDGDTSESGDGSRRGMTEYTVTIEEHVAQDFPVEAHDIFHAVDSAMQKYKAGKLVVQPTTPTARMIMARDDGTGETTEWTGF